MGCNVHECVVCYVLGQRPHLTWDQMLTQAADVYLERKQNGNVK